MVRRALQAYATQRSGIAITDTPSTLDLVGDLVGCFSGAPADLSSNPAHMADFGCVLQVTNDLPGVSHVGMLTRAA
jgi:hypothetical protein